MILDNLCINDALFSKVAQNITISDYGGRKTFSIQKRVAFNPVYIQTCILAWFTCENNANHMYGETLIPTFNTMKRLDKRLDTRLDRDVTVMVPSKGPWVDHDGCKGTHYAEVFSHMAISREILFLNNTYSLNTFSNRPSRRDVCCTKTVVNIPTRGRPSAFYVSLLHSYGITCKTSRRYGIIVQRLKSRYITNVDALKMRLQQRMSVPFEVTVFETMTIREQMQTAACASYFVGVQGQGMEWAHFMQMGANKGYTLELEYHGWPCMYSGLLQANGKLARCMKAIRTNTHPNPKYDNVTALLEF